jgi:hypothetical protein
LTGRKREMVFSPDNVRQSTSDPLVYLKSAIFGGPSRKSRVDYRLYLLGVNLRSWTQIAFLADRVVKVELTIVYTCYQMRLWVLLAVTGTQCAS